MTDQQYEPTTDDILRCYMQRGGSEEEFNRWHSAEIAAAEQRGAERGWDKGYLDSDDEAYFFSTHGCTPNPYRADRITDKEFHND